MPFQDLREFFHLGDAVIGDILALFLASSALLAPDLCRSS